MVEERGVAWEKEDKATMLWRYIVVVPTAHLLLAISHVPRCSSCATPPVSWSFRYCSRTSSPFQSKHLVIQSQKINSLIVQQLLYIIQYNPPAPSQPRTTPISSLGPWKLILLEWHLFYSNVCCQFYILRLSRWHRTLRHARPIWKNLLQSGGRKDLGARMEAIWKSRPGSGTRVAISPCC